MRNLQRKLKPRTRNASSRSPPFQTVIKQENYWLDHTTHGTEIFPPALVIMGDMQDANIDSIIEQLLSVRGTRPGRQVTLTENEIRWLCVRSKEIFSSQPVLLELEAPLKICGE